MKYRVTMGRAENGVQPREYRRDIHTLRQAVEYARQVSQSSTRWVDKPIDVDVRDESGRIVATANAATTERDPNNVCLYCGGEHPTTTCSR